jgi:ABC-2 type transport system permease protein
VIPDVRTVAWKELIELRRGSGAGGNRSLAGIAVFTLLFSVVVPVSAGEGGFGGLGVLAVGALVAAVWVLTTVPDAFAGERDRHTLETLLATRLPARAILIGKAAANVVCASALGLVAIVLAIVAGNVGGITRHGQEGIEIPWLDAGIGVLVLIATAILLTNLGILVALRASSALNAQKMLGLGLAGLALLVTFGVQALPRGIRADLVSVGEDVETWNAALLVALAVLVLVVTNVALVAATLARFTRPALVRR